MEQLHFLNDKNLSDSGFLDVKNGSDSRFLGVKKWSYSALLGGNYLEKNKKFFYQFLPNNWGEK